MLKWVRLVKQARLSEPQINTVFLDRTTRFTGKKFTTNEH